MYFSMHTNMNIYRLVQRRSMACSNFNTYIHTYIHFDICKYAFLVYIFSIHTHICTDRLTQRRSVARSDFNRGTPPCSLPLRLPTCMHRLFQVALQCVAVCCKMKQCVAVCCSVLQCVAVCSSVLQNVAIYFYASTNVYALSLAGCVEVCCSV